jgi:hypothetical protein
MAGQTHQRVYGQGGGYGQNGPGLNFRDDGAEGFDSAPYRVPLDRDAGGFHAGPYEAEHYREPSEREPGARRDQYQPRWDDRPLNTGHRGKGPRGYRRADARIEEDVNQHLTDDDRLDASDIRVAVRDGEVTLDGTVDSRDAKHRAERLIEDVSGVRHVQNNLRVQTSNVSYRPPSPLGGAERPGGGSADGAASRSRPEQSQDDLDSPEGR